MNTIYEFDPIRDPRWSELLQRHPRASVFHSPAWLEALRRTYDYQPLGFTTSAPDAEHLANGLVFCRIRSWLTGERLVSLPFSDHCEPLVENAEIFDILLPYLRNKPTHQNSKYIELRPFVLNAGVGQSNGFCLSNRYCIHSLDLRPDIEKVFQCLHKSCVQRKIKRAEREGLVYKKGRSRFLIRKFYNLLLSSRRKQRLPPQPIEWFFNLANTLGNSFAIRIAEKDDHQVAAILTLSFKDTMVYKYGCSDAKSTNLGGMPFLFWMTIREAKDSCFTEFDLGRSDRGNTGLITFKEHLGGKGRELCYLSYPQSCARNISLQKDMQIPEPVIACLPNSVLVLAGKILYKHFG